MIAGFVLAPGCVLAGAEVLMARPSAAQALKAAPKMTTAIIETVILIMISGFFASGCLDKLNRL
jgi:hypothetical protein